MKPKKNREPQQGRTRRKTPKAPLQPVVPQWAVQPYLYQQLLLRWFETLHGDLKELGSILERVESVLERIDEKTDEN